MSKTYFISDTHFGHANIILYANRPQLKTNDYTIQGKKKVWISKDIAKKRVEAMDRFLINNWNARIKQEDTVYFLGDFCFRNSGTENRAEYYINQLNGRIVFIRGNHDRNNGLNVKMTKAILEFSKKVIMVQHYPIEHPDEIPDFVDIVLCGHVHNAWKYKMVSDTPVINMSVDVWNYYPVTYQEIIRFINREIFKGEK